MGNSEHSPQARHRLDVVGATASLACAVHCAAVALLLGVLPAVSVISAHWIDWAFLSLSTMIGIAALGPGFRRHHLRTPLALFTIGIGILVLTRVLGLQPSVPEMLLVMLAAACLIAAHWKNRTALHRCACAPQAHRHVSDQVPAATTPAPATLSAPSSPLITAR